MSIRPAFARGILAGTKKVEFRRRPPRQNPRIALIYATAPVGQLVGLFEILSVKGATPQTLWRRYRGVAGIDRKSFMGYFAGCSRGFAIEIGDVYELSRPVSLAELITVKHAPPSFTYLPGAVVRRLASEVGFSPGI